MLTRFCRSDGTVVERLQCSLIPFYHATNTTSTPVRSKSYETARPRSTRNRKAREALARKKPDAPFTRSVPSVSRHQTRSRSSIFLYRRSLRKLLFTIERLCEGLASWSRFFMRTTKKNEDGVQNLCVTTKPGQNRWHKNRTLLCIGN
jgi:hypothetical protein